MARPKAEYPAYRKHRPTGQAVVTINGRDHYLGPHGTKASKLVYDRLILEWVSAGRPANFGEPESVLLVAALLVAYLRHAKGYYGGGMRGEYANILSAVRPLKELYSRTNAVDFGPLQLKAIREKLIGQKLSRSTINSRIRKIMRAFRWAAGEGLIPASVPQSLSMVDGLRRGRSDAEESPPVRPVELATVEATITHLSPTVASMVRLQLCTGCRPGEVVKLRASDIDKTTGDVWQARLSDHKTAHHGHERVLYLGPAARSILTPLLEKSGDGYLFSPVTAEAESRAKRSSSRRVPLSCGNKPKNQGANRHRPFGAHFTTQTYARAITRACEKFGIPHWSPNQIRHLVATRIRRDHGLDAASVLLGHHSLAVTQGYAERDEKRAIEVAKRIG